MFRREKEYGLIISQTDTAEGIFSAVRDTGGAIFKVLNFEDETIAGQFYLGISLGLERKKIIRDEIRKSGILNCRTIFFVIGTGGGGAGLALEELRVLMEEVSSRNWVNMILVISEKKNPRSEFNTMETFVALNETADMHNNLSVTLVSNRAFLSNGYRGYPLINQDIVKWLITETLASILARYDIENVISRPEFKYSTVSLKTATMRDALTENKEVIANLAGKAIDELWLSNGDIPIGNPEGICGVWLNAATPGNLYKAFRKAEMDIDGMLNGVIDDKFSNGGGTITDILKNSEKERESSGSIDYDPDTDHGSDCEGVPAIYEEEGNHFESKTKEEITVVSRVAIDREAVEEFFRQIKSFLEEVWNSVKSGKEAPKRLKPYVRVANQQKEWKEKIEKWEGKGERKGEKDVLEA